MMEVLFVSLVVIFSCCTKRKNIVLLLVFLLPFNDFVKKCCVLYGGGGTLFSFWKELAILILFYRSYKYIEKENLNMFIPLYLFLCVLLVFYFVLGMQKYDASVCFRTARNVLIIPLLFISLNGLVVNNTFIKKLVILLTIPTFIISLIGIWEIHMGGRIFLRTFMGNITQNNLYNVPNFKIMGLDRMCSIMTVPNSFGYLMAFYGSFMLFLFLNMRELFDGKWKFVLQIIWIIAMSCLLESFCRTGWFMFIFSYFIALYYKNKSYFFKRILIFFVVGSCLLLIAYFISPDIKTIVDSTLTGKEASAADRSNNFSRGISFVLNNPYGHGLGSSDNSLDNYVYFAESSFINLSVEIGIFGTCFYILFLLILLYMVRESRSDFTPFSISIMCVNLISIMSTSVYVTPYIYFVFIFSGMAIMRRRKFHDEINKKGIALYFILKILNLKRPELKEPQST